MSRRFLLLAALGALLAVALGAFGAHGLRHVLGERELANYQTGVHYQMWHALGLGLIGLLARQYPASRLLAAAGWSMAGGIVAFSGSLYLLSLTGQRWLGMITPLGGTAFLAGWLLLAVAAARLPREP
jgi:uncharacterized membrane protein YgdD (TMEM256/DUF423 family)